MLLLEAIWRCYNGHEARAVPGMRTHVPMLQVEAIWRSYNGLTVKAVPGMSGHVPVLPKEDLCQCCSWRPHGSVAMGQRARLSLG